jgi:hypothetical protein
LLTVRLFKDGKPQITKWAASGCHSQWSWSATQLHGKLWRATNLQKLLPISLQFGMFRQGGAYFAKDPRRMFIRRFGQPVVHPLSLAPPCHNPGPPHVSQVARNLWLARS